MSSADLTTEHKNILRTLREHHGLHLREIHQALVETENSRFRESPDYGDGWNQERWKIKELRDELAEQGLITNDYQTWSLTQTGREVLS